MLDSSVRVSIARHGAAWALGVAVLASSLGFAESAAAQQRDPAAAQALFDEAKRLEGSGRLGEACPKFLASFNLDPKPGAAFNLGSCYERNGQTASAWARYVEAASMADSAGQSTRASYARDAAKALEPKLSRVTVAVAKPAPGLTVRRDGVVLDAATWGIAVPVDPGSHAFEATAPGRTAWSTTVEVPARAGALRVEVPELREARATGAAPPVVAAPLAPLAPGPPPPAAEPWGARRIAGVALMGAGGIGLVIGAAFAADAHAKFDTLSQACPSHTNCDPSLSSELSSYHMASAVSTTGFVAAGALFASGLVVFLTSPKAGPRPAAFVAPRVGLGSFALEGRFQ